MKGDELVRCAPLQHAAVLDLMADALIDDDSEDDIVVPDGALIQ